MVINIYMNTKMKRLFDRTELSRGDVMNYKVWNGDKVMLISLKFNFFLPILLCKLQKFEILKIFGSLTMI